MKEAHGSRFRGLKFDPWAEGLLFILIVVVPVLLSLASAEVSLERSKSLQFCGSCHVMDPYVSDLKDPESATLASLHFQHRWINSNPCYTCHTDYGMFGTVDAKWRGLKHVVHNVMGPSRPIALYKPFSNANCLQCHEAAPTFLSRGPHRDLLGELRSGSTGCLTCHGPAHPPQEGVR